MWILVRESAVVRIEKPTFDDGISCAVEGHHHLHAGEVASTVSDDFVEALEATCQLPLPMTYPGSLVPVAGYIRHRCTAHDPCERCQVRERDLPRHVRGAAGTGIGRVVNEHARKRGLDDRLGPVVAGSKFGPSVWISVAV